MRLTVTESERLIMLADREGWPNVTEMTDDVIIWAGPLYIYWRHERGSLVYASDNLGPIPKPLAKTVETFIRDRRQDQDFARRAGLTGKGN